MSGDGGAVVNLAREQAEMLRAAIVLAVADGVISASERGLLASLAKRVGISQETLERMIARALADSGAREECFRTASSDPELALELLVAAARIDGHLHEREKQALVQMAERLDVPISAFDEVYARGVARADALRTRK